MAFKPLTVNTPIGKKAHILAEDDAALYDGIFGEDCVLKIGEQFASKTISNNVIRVMDGVVVVGGHVGRRHDDRQWNSGSEAKRSDRCPVSKRRDRRRGYLQSRCRERNTGIHSKGSGDRTGRFVRRRKAEGLSAVPGAD